MVLYEDYSRNAPCALNQISTFLFQVVTFKTSNKRSPLWLV